MEANDFEDAVRNAISLGGDADTLACIAGSIAEPYFGGVPADIRESVLLRLDDELLAVVTRIRAACDEPLTAIFRGASRLHNLSVLSFRKATRDLSPANCAGGRSLVESSSLRAMRNSPARPEC